MARLYNNRTKSLNDYNKYLAYYYKTMKRQKATARFIAKVLGKVNNAYLTIKVSEAINEPIEEKYWTQEQFDKEFSTNR